MEYLIVLFVVYTAFVGFLYLNQRSMIYFPDQTRPLPAFYNLPESVIVQTSTSDGLDLEGWFIPPSQPGYPVVVIFHGNASNHGWRAYKAGFFIRQGYGAMLASYRGYGGNPGAPTEDGLMNDARAWMQFLSGRGINPEQIILYGESLGTGIAVQMATEFKARALILEAPYTSLPDVAAAHYPFVPVHLLQKDRYNNLALIKDVHMPILVLHGEQDMTVPFRLGRALYEAANQPKTLVALPKASHNDIYENGAALHVYEFLRTIGLPVQSGAVQ